MAYLKLAQNEFPEEEELVLCTVSKIEGTTVFVNIDRYSRTGVIPTSEIAPGRIRNIRDYVVPNKKLICKVLRVDRSRGHVDLSLRRVTRKDSQEELQKYKKDDTAFTILEIVLKEKTREIADKITSKNESLFEFLESSKESPKLLEQFMDKEDAKKINKIVMEKIKEKKVSVKTTIKLSSTGPEGINLIKEVLSIKNAKVTYLGAPSYMISVEAKDYKEANKKLEEILDKLEQSLKGKTAKLELMQE